MRRASILQTDSPASLKNAVLAAATLLKQGQVVAIPTETVYGLAAKAHDANAVQLLFEIKGRPALNPVIVHVASLEMAVECATSWPTLAQKLAAAFWPGPLTIVVQRSNAIPDVVTAGGNTVGLRWPSHPVAQAIIRACGFPLAAPSANRSNEVSPTSADHVLKSLGDQIDLIVDGGQAQVGIESTVIDVTVHPPRLLRPGIIDETALISVTGELARTSEGAEEVLRSPGLLRRHYAPRARLDVLEWEDDGELERQINKATTNPDRVHIIAHTNIPLSFGAARVSVVPHDAEAFARALYSELHRCDEAGAEWIVIEKPPVAPGWAAIADRLARASAKQE